MNFSDHTPATLHHPIVVTQITHQLMVIVLFLGLNHKANIPKVITFMVFIPVSLIEISFLLGEPVNLLTDFQKKGNEVNNKRWMLVVQNQVHPKAHICWKI